MRRSDALNFRRFIRLTFNASALFPVFILDVLVTESAEGFTGTLLPDGGLSDICLLIIHFIFQFNLVPRVLSYPLPGNEVDFNS